MKRKYVGMLCAALVATAVLMPAVVQSAQAASEPQRFKLNFVAASLATVADAVASVTGASIAIAPGAQASITLAPVEALTKEELLAAFSQAVAAQGLVVSQQGNSVRIGQTAPRARNFASQN